mgnify:CR=1 FL=1
MISEIKKLNKIDKDSVISKTFLLSKEENIEIYYAPFDYINSKALVFLVRIHLKSHQYLFCIELS